MEFLASTLVSIIRLGSLFFGAISFVFAWSIFSGEQNVMGQIIGMIVVLCGVISVGIYAIVSILGGISADMQKYRNGVAASSTGSNAVSPLDLKK